VKSTGDRLSACGSSIRSILIEIREKMAEVTPLASTLLCAFKNSLFQIDGQKIEIQT
jgi:hypothetical protein